MFRPNYNILSKLFEFIISSIYQFSISNTTTDEIARKLTQRKKLRQGHP